MKTSPRARPISPSSVLEQLARPGRRTAGPACPRSRPGASPTNIRSASALPAPKTTEWRVAASCGHLVHALRLLPDRLELLAPRRRGSHAVTIARVRRAK